MEYFQQFQWWYIPLGILALFLMFGKSKGGIVVTRVSANLQPLDGCYSSCRSKARYSTFKPGEPDSIDIRVDGLTLEPGTELALELNNKSFATVNVRKKGDIKFDHWSDEGIDFPKIRAGDKLEIIYQGTPIFAGTFV